MSLQKTTKPISSVDLMKATNTARENLISPHEKTLIREVMAPNTGVILDTLKEYQSLSNQLTNWIIKNSLQKIPAATLKGHGWTNIFQYLPTNHPNGIAQHMPTCTADIPTFLRISPQREINIDPQIRNKHKNTNKDTDDLTLKYFSGTDKAGFPLKERNGTPIILLIQGPKIGSKRSLDVLREKRIIPVMDQLNTEIKKIFPGVRLIHKWTGKNGNIIEAVWDHVSYETKSIQKNPF